VITKTTCFRVVTNGAVAGEAACIKFFGLTDLTFVLVSLFF